MIKKHNTAIINDVIIEQNIKNFDPRWIARGCFSESRRIWIMNIPKNGSNSIGRLIAPGNRPRPGWQTEARYTELGEPSDKFIVVLRNPVERFCGSLAQHYVNGLEHGKSLAEINAKIDSLEWITDKFDDMHIWPQFTYLHGIPWNQCVFLTMDALPTLSGMVDISADIENWNITKDNDTKYATKKRIQTIIKTNPKVSNHVSEYYETDYDMINLAIKHIPHR